MPVPQSLLAESLLSASRGCDFGSEQRVSRWSKRNAAQRVSIETIPVLDLRCPSDDRRLLMLHEPINFYSGTGKRTTLETFILITTIQSFVEPAPN